MAEKAGEDDYFPNIVRPKAASIGPMARKAFAKAYAAGVKIAFGTDSGVSVHGENAREFELMVEGGMPPMKAIQSATLEAARLLKIDDRLGTLEKNKAQWYRSRYRPPSECSIRARIPENSRFGKRW